MDEGSEHVRPDEVYGLVVAALAQLQEPAEVHADGVRLLNWPSVRISLNQALAYPGAPDSEVWQAWVDLTCMYNTELLFTAAKTHVVGIGLGRSKAITDAIDSWRQGIAPALISYIYGVLVADADSWPAADGRAPDGWDCITGPYVLRGDQASVATLGAFLKQEPMIGPVRDHLAATLETGAPFHTVSLYRAQTAAGIFADVLIDNELDSAAGEILKRMQWPEQLSDAPYIAARHFMLCIAPGAAGSGPAPDKRMDRRREQAHDRNRRIVIVIVFLTLAIAFSCGLHEALVALTAWLAPSADGAVLTLMPVTPFWWAPASVLGALLAGVVVSAAVYLRDRRGARGTGYALHGMPVKLIALCVFLFVFMGLVTYFAAHSYLQLRPDEIVLRRMWSFATERYPYSHVLSLDEEGEPGRRGSRFSIHFKDAPAWSTRREVIFPGAAEKQYLANRTGLEIRRVPMP